MMKTKVIVPLVQHVRLFNVIFGRTNDYIKTKEIMKSKYNVDIRLEPVR